MRFGCLSNSSLAFTEEQSSFSTTGPGCVSLQCQDLVEAVALREGDDHRDVRRKAWSCEDVGNDQEDVAVAEHGQDVPASLGGRFLAEHRVANVVQLFGDHLGGTDAATNHQNAAEGSLVSVIKLI